MSTPRLAGFHMPPEWAPHERTWMEFPPANETFGDNSDASLGAARRAWTAVTNAIAKYEPVSLVCNIGDSHVAQEMVGPNVTIFETPTNDAWVRDSGPTFLVHPDARLGATHWRFNAWGNAGFSRFDDEQHVGAFIAGLAGAELFSSEMVNEGGAIHVDGEGTVMLTETVQLDPGRNPDWEGERAETEMKSFLGIAKSLWFPRGLTRDYDRFGTRGHVDMFACFASPGVVLAHVQPDPAHPDHEVCKENVGILRASTDVRGRPLHVVEIKAPTVTHEDGDIVDWTYINHYICNGAVILCGFNDPRDDEAAATLATVYPGRDIVLVDARPIFACGGGIHCITQQQPRVA